MARRTSDIETEEVEMDLTPMIDVVFLLLVFFMLAAKFKTQEGQILSYLPKDRGMNSGKKNDVTETRIFISWCRRGGYQLSKDPRNGRPVIRVGNPTTGFKRMEKNGQPDFEALKELLAREKVAQAGANKGEGLKVKIDGQPLVPWKFVVLTLDVAVQVGITDVTFAAKDEPIN